MFIMNKINKTYFFTLSKQVKFIRNLIRRVKNII